MFFNELFYIVHWAFMEREVSYFFMGCFSLLQLCYTYIKAINSFKFGTEPTSHQSWTCSDVKAYSERGELFVKLIVKHLGVVLSSLMVQLWLPFVTKCTCGLFFWYVHEFDLLLLIIVLSSNLQILLILWNHYLEIINM